MNSFLLLILSILVCTTLQSSEESKDVINRKQFYEIISKARFVVALFSEPCCQCTDCVEAEALLASISDELLRDEIVTVKLMAQDDLAKAYGVHETPSLVFIRSKKPILYDGKFEHSELMEWLSRSQDRNVKELSDETFEHLTQAATGATTGDWLVTFYDRRCQHLGALEAVCDSVAVRLKGRINVAVVSSEQSPGLKERFSITKCPTIVFFRLGKMYSYDLSLLTPESLRSFAEGFYRNAKAMQVPNVPSPFDKLVDRCVWYLKDNSWTLPIGVILVLVLFVILTFVSLQSKSIKSE